ncbi:MAG: hypothetical protein PS018_21860 [bacterium]|nr:hypothetical protein [bacterium]
MSNEPETERDDASTQQPPRRSAVRRVIFWIAVAWFCCYHFLFVILLAVDSNHFDKDYELSIWMLVFMFAGGLMWLGSAYWIYDKLFRMAQARWPEAKRIREILSPLLRSFLHPHH